MNIKKNIYNDIGEIYGIYKRSQNRNIDNVIQV